MWELCRIANFKKKTQVNPLIVVTVVMSPRSLLRTNIGGYLSKTVKKKRKEKRWFHT
jgi:ribosomal protein S17E